MELPSKILGQTAYNTRSGIEEHMLIVMDKSTHEEHLSQPLQTNNKQFKIAVSFLSWYNGVFNVTDKNIEILVHKNNYWWRWLYTDYHTSWCSRIWKL